MEFKGTKGLTYERLIQVLIYNELTGIFIWKETLGSFNTEKEALKIRKEAEFRYNYHFNHGK